MFLELSAILLGQRALISTAEEDAETLSITKCYTKGQKQDMATLHTPYTHLEIVSVNEPTRNISQIPIIVENSCNTVWTAPCRMGYTLALLCCCSSSSGPGDDVSNRPSSRLSLIFHKCLSLCNSIDAPQYNHIHGPPSKLEKQVHRTHKHTSLQPTCHTPTHSSRDMAAMADSGLEINTLFSLTDETREMVDEVRPTPYNILLLMFKIRTGGYGDG